MPRIRYRLLLISDEFLNFILLLQQFGQLVHRHAAQFCICATPRFPEFYLGYPNSSIKTKIKKKKKIKKMEISYKVITS